MFKWLRVPLGGQSGKKPAKDEPSSRELWDTDFKIVAKGGLDVDQVIAYVDDLKTRHQESQDAQAASVRSIVQTALGDAQEIADKIRVRAEKDAEAAASSLVAEAKKDAEGIKQRAEAEANQTAERTAAAADKSARITEAEAQDKAVLFLLRAREQIEREVIGEFNVAYTRLTDTIEALVDSGKELQADLRDRREALLKSKVFELTEGDVPLIGVRAGIAGSDVEVAVDVASADAKQTAGAKKASKGAKESSKRAKKASATVDAEPAAEEAVTVRTEPAAEPAAVASAPAEDPVAVEPGMELPEAAGAAGSDDAVATADSTVSGDEMFSELTEEEAQALYIGEVDIVVPTPVDAKLMSQLHRYLQTTPEIKLVRTAGSMGRGTVVTIAIDKPVPLIGALSSRIPDAAIALERRRRDGSPGLPGATKRIRMVSKTD